MGLTGLDEAAVALIPIGGGLCGCLMLVVILLCVVTRKQRRKQKKQLVAAGLGGDVAARARAALQRKEAFMRPGRTPPAPECADIESRGGSGAPLPDRTADVAPRALDSTWPEIADARERPSRSAPSQPQRITRTSRSTADTRLPPPAILPSPLASVGRTHDGRLPPPTTLPSPSPAVLMQRIQRARAELRTADERGANVSFDDGPDELHMQWLERSRAERAREAKSFTPLGAEDVFDDGAGALEASGGGQSAGLRADPLRSLPQRTAFSPELTEREARALLESFIRAEGTPRHEVLSPPTPVRTSPSAAYGLTPQARRQQLTWLDRAMISAADPTFDQRVRQHL